MGQIIVAYVPVLHEGYRRLFEKYPDARKLYIFGSEITTQFDYLKKDIRALDPFFIKKAVEAWGIFDTVEVLDLQGVEFLKKTNEELVVPDEDITRELAQKYFSDKKIVFDSIFLRWNKHNALAEKPIVYDQKISVTDFDREVLRKAEDESKKSADFWRHVGGAIVKDGVVIMIARNKHVPSDHMPYAHSDPRNAFHKGIHIELSTVLHAEAGLIAEAARQGVSLEGTSMYVTVFPCPPCAKSIAYCGVKRLYCAGGYAVLDGQDILKSRGVEIIFVE